VALTCGRAVRTLQDPDTFRHLLSRPSSPATHETQDKGASTSAGPASRRSGDYVGHCPTLPRGAATSTLRPRKKRLELADRHPRIELIFKLALAVKRSSRIARSGQRRGLGRPNRATDRGVAAPVSRRPGHQPSQEHHASGLATWEGSSSPATAGRPTSTSASSILVVAPATPRPTKHHRQHRDLPARQSRQMWALLVLTR